MGKPKWSRNTHGTQQMMRRKSSQDTLLKAQKLPVSNQARSSSSSQVDSEERELSASSNSNPVFLLLPDLTRSMVSQSEELTKFIPSAPPLWLTLPVSTPLQSLTRLLPERPQPRDLDPKNSSLKTPQRQAPPMPERNCKKTLTPPLSRTSRTRWSSDISELDSPSPAMMLLIP